MADFIPFGSPDYWVLLAGLCASRGMDFLSTWLATPNLHLEANPIAKRLGWRWGLLLNGGICLWFATWPLPAIIIGTTSLLVAARNFQSVWLMRSLGEQGYRFWLRERLRESPLTLYVLCLLAQSFLTAVLGGLLILFGHNWPVRFGIGMGLITYAIAVTIFSMLAVWRLRRF